MQFARRTGRLSGATGGVRPNCMFNGTPDDLEGH